MLDKKSYIQHCLEDQDIPLFYTPVWLDLVTNYLWDGAITRNPEGKVTAIMPIHIKKKWGVTALVNPKLTPSQGIYFTKWAEEKTEQKRQSRIFKSTKELIKDLGKPTLYKVRFHSSYDMWLPFYFEDYRQTTYYSYVLENINLHEEIFSGFKYNTKNIIRQAEKELTVTETKDLDVFYVLVEKTFAQKKESTPFLRNFLEKLSTSLKDDCQFLLAIDSVGNPLAGMCLVYDKNTAYNLIFGTDFDFVKTGAPSFLIWEGIKKASQRVNRFDFEGSRLPTIQPFYQSFGGKPIPYFEISKAGNSFWKLLFNLTGSLS